MREKDMADKEAIDVGQDIAKILLDWRPGMNYDDVTEAIMHALESASIQVEGGSEAKMKACVFELRRKLEERTMSF